MPFLIFADHEQEFDRCELYANSRAIIVGRAADCDVPVRDILLSRHHCRFDPLGDRWIVSDLGSKNGTRVEGRQIERHLLRDGEVIRVGRTRICFRAGAFEPITSGARRRADARPVDPVEALASTVSGFHLGDMEEDSRISGFPIPRPKPAEPVAYGRENVGAMVVELASRSWEGTNVTSIPTERRTARSVERPRAPVAPQVASIPLEQKPVAGERTFVRWRVVISIGLGIGVCAAALAVIATGWLTRAPAR